MVSIKKSILVGILIIFLTFSIGLYTGIKNSSDYHIKSMQFDEISEEVRVYRDEYNVPTIIAENQADLFFAQGFEYARDRLWQAEFYRAIANGELSKLFGAGEDDSLVSSDKYLKVLGIKETAESVTQRLSPDLKFAIQRYIDGLNKYIDIHRNNLPIEFEILGITPSHWTISDSIAMQGVMAQTLSLSSMSREILRQDLAILFGPERAEQIYPIEHADARSYYASLNTSNLSLSPNTNRELPGGFFKGDMGSSAGSNNWVVGPEKSATGNPLIANDPHLALSTPSIWWQVHLVSPDFHVEGYSLPGTPGITIGHNENVAWGMTNTGIDTLDLFYFEERNSGSQYYHEGQWKDYDIVTKEIEVKNGETRQFDIKYTDVGPVLDPELFGVPEDRPYAMKWVLHEDIPRNNIFRAIFDMNRAESADDLIDALEYFSIPGQNIVFAETNGTFGYQFTGMVPIRKVPGSGLVPQNGSDPSFGWSGYVPYEQNYKVIPEADSYFATANEKVDRTESFYIADSFAIGYRAQRINDLLENDGSVTLNDMQAIQGDILNLYAEEILDETLDEIKAVTFSEDISSQGGKALDELVAWNRKMDRKEIGATVFIVFRVLFERETFSDEFEQQNSGVYETYDNNAEKGIKNIIHNASNSWFDDVTTEIVENRADIAQRAMIKTVEYLIDNFGKRKVMWRYERVHEVIFEHPMGEALGIFNTGKKAFDGSEHTVKADGDTPEVEDGIIDFTSSFASSMRYIAEVEPSWSSVRGILPPGQSGHFLSGHRRDNVEDWINNELHAWDFSTSRKGTPDFTYKKD